MLIIRGVTHKNTGNAVGALADSHKLGGIFENLKIFYSRAGK